MRRGVDVIYQGTLQIGSQWLGRADFLRRVSVPSSLGVWSYEPVDTKLARSVKASAVLQLCFYAELLAQLQGMLPRQMTLVLGDLREETFQTVRYVAYFRYVRARLTELLGTPPSTYPEPVAHCNVCDYARECDAQRRTDDHLSLVAGITTSQRQALALASVRTVQGLRRLASRALESRGIGAGGVSAHTRAGAHPDRGPECRVDSLRTPARRGTRPRSGDASRAFPGRHLSRLRGRPVRARRRDRVPGSGCAWRRRRRRCAAALHRALGVPPWTPSAGQLPKSLSAFACGERRAHHPGMHVYHYNHYEPTALKQLAGRYATCIDELDELLRGKVFVDLYRVVRQSLRASVESYSLKKIGAPIRVHEDRPAAAGERVPRRCFRSLDAKRRHETTPEDAVRQTIKEGYEPRRLPCHPAFARLAGRATQRDRAEWGGSHASCPRVWRSKRGPPRAARARTSGGGRSAERRATRSGESESCGTRPLRALLICWRWHRREDKSSYWEYLPPSGAGRRRVAGRRDSARGADSTKGAGWDGQTIAHPSVPLPATRSRSRSGIETRRPTHPRERGRASPNRRRVNAPSTSCEGNGRRCRIRPLSSPDARSRTNSSGRLSFAWESTCWRAEWCRPPLSRRASRSSTAIRLRRATREAPRSRSPCSGRSRLQ